MPLERLWPRSRSARLLETQHAQGLLYDYVMALITRDPEAMARLWKPEGVLEAKAGTYRGRREIVDYYTMQFGTDPRAKSHIIGPQRVTWERPGVVRIRSTFLVAVPGPGPLLGWGTYDDLVEVSGEVALFASKRIQVEWLDPIG